MPGRFPLFAVPLGNDPFCIDEFCGGGGGLLLSPVYDYCAFGNIPIRVFWTTNTYNRRFNCSTGEIATDQSSTFSGSIDRTTGTVWAATKDINYPGGVPGSQPFPPVGYFSPILNWNIPCGTPSFTMSLNGVILGKSCDTNTTVETSLYGGNASAFNNIRYEFGQALVITKIELRGNVAGLGVIGDDITARGLTFPSLGNGGLPASQTFTSFANATP